MSVCGGLEHIFEKPLPESPTFLESISPWKHAESMKTVDHHSFTEIFGQISLNENHVHDSLESSTSSPPFPPSSLSSSLSSNSEFSDCANPTLSVVVNPKSGENGIQEKKQHMCNDRISSMNSEILSTYTEETGFDSSDDVENLLNNDDCNDDWQPQEDRIRICTRTGYENYWCNTKRSRRNIGLFPPPISCIGRNGKPWVSFKSFRQDGRFVLKEIRSPTQEFLHACRENGRLRMQIVLSDDEILDKDEEDEEYEENNKDTEENEDGDSEVVTDRNGEWKGVKGENKVKTSS